MPEFYYKSVTRDGDADEGTMTAASAEAVIRSLQDMGRIPIAATEIAPRRSILPSLRLPQSWRRARKPNVVALMQSLSSLAGAGLSLDRSLDIVQEVERDDATRELAGELQSTIRGGASLSEALQTKDRLFSSYMVSMVQAAEISGTIADGLARIADYLERSREMRDKVVSALIYPVILAVVAGLSVLVLMLFVVPQFRSVFEEMGNALPLATRVVLAVSDFFTAYGWIVVLLFAVVAVPVAHRFRRPETRHKLDAFVLRIPLVGDLVRKIETARLARTAGTMLANGVPLLTGLSVAEKTLSNHVLSRAVAAATADLREGGDLSGALVASGQFPGLAIQMIKVGEETGRLDRMLARVSDVYDREVELATRRALALVEPVLIIGLGILIAGIIMSILVGIISINDLPI